MRKNERGLPEVVFLGPPKHRIEHKLTVFIIEEKDADGIPTRLRMLRDDESVDVQEGMEFMTGYVQVQMTLPKEIG